MKHLYVVRHAESIHHTEDRVGGWYDTGITDLGKGQAKKTAKRLEELLGGEEVTLHSSDLLRSSETAEIIAEHLKLDVHITKNLRESSCGSAEGKPQSWLRERMIPPPQEGNRLDHVIFPGSESRRALANRVYPEVERILHDPTDRSIIVTHGFVITFIIAAWMRIDVDQLAYATFEVHPCSITILHEDDFFHNRVLESLNHVAHLRD